MSSFVNELSDILGAPMADFLVEGNTIILKNQKCNFYHKNYFSTVDLELVCERYDAKGVIFFNSDGTVTFVVKVAKKEVPEQFISKS